jgi:hypothetical protein
MCSVFLGLFSRFGIDDEKLLHCSKSTAHNTKIKGTKSQDLKAQKLVKLALYEVVISQQKISSKGCQ